MSLPISETVEQTPVTAMMVTMGSDLRVIPRLLPPVTSQDTEKSSPLVGLPRELRDQIYRYLLSTTYSKHETGERETVSFNISTLPIVLISQLGNEFGPMRLSLPPIYSSRQPPSVE